MIGKIDAKDSRRTRQFKPQIHQNKGRGQNRGYGQRNYQNRYRSDNRSNSSGKIEVDTDLSKVIEEIISEIIPEDTVDKITEESIGIIIIEMIAMTEVGIGLEKGHFQEIMVVTELGVQAIVE